MAKVVKAVGNEVNKGLNRLTYTNPITWGVIPGAITGILILTIIAVLQIPLTGESEVRVCKKSRDGVKDCENKIIEHCQTLRQQPINCGKRSRYPRYGKSRAKRIGGW